MNNPSAIERRDYLAQLMEALASDCNHTDGWEHAAPDLREVATLLRATYRPSEAEEATRFGPVQQRWVLNIPFMQQSVLFAAVRAPDGLRKDHPVKVLLRWYRRCILLSAFDKRVLGTPFEEGGGSFTGPFGDHHARDIFGLNENLNGWPLGHWFDLTRQVYLRHVDEIPHHFQLHFMHAAQIVGVHHPDDDTRHWWRTFYLMIVNDAHLHPETDAEMNLRLSDNDAEWKAREEVTAK
jgi:hypothetical protein